MSSPTVLVTDGEQRSALAVVRALGRAGYQVYVTSESGASLAGASRYTIHDFRVSSALKAPDSYAAEHAEAVRRIGAQIVIPIAEPSALSLLPERERLSPAVIPFPSLQSFLHASDKLYVAQLAEQTGIRVPRQYTVMSREQAEELPEWTRNGVVLKPGRSVNSGRKLSVSYTPAGHSTIRAIQALPAAAFPLLVQERVTGPGVGLFLLRWNGETVAAFAHRRIREKPPSGGVSVVRESVPVSADLQQRSERLLDALQWSGVAMLEFKQSADTGVPYLMEINGRFWGSLQLAIDSGVDFPSLLVAAALNRGPRPCHAYKHGVRSRWLLGDVDHLLLRLFKREDELNLPADAPGKAQVFTEFVWDFVRPNRLEVFRMTDPRPFLREVGLWLRRS